MNSEALVSSARKSSAPSETRGPRAHMCWRPRYMLIVEASTLYFGVDQQLRADRHCASAASIFAVSKPTMVEPSMTVTGVVMNPSRCSS
jgi:hypothetical protein